jgi:hypothetical protein
MAFSIVSVSQQGVGAGFAGKGRQESARYHKIKSHSSEYIIALRCPGAPER